MKKLAFVINVFREDDFHSGGERVFYELVNRAVESGYVVDLYCASYLSKQNILKPKLNKIVFVGHPKDFKCSEKIEKFYEEVKKLIHNENYDHVISENISPPVDIGILQGHSLLHYRKFSGNILSRALFTLKKHKFIKAQKKWLKQGYSKIIVPSNTLKNELKLNFGINDDEKLVVIYPGVDIPANQEQMLNKVQHGDNHIITFGISAPSFSKKGGNVFLNALSILKKKGYKFKAKIIYPKAKKNFKLQFQLLNYGLKDLIEFLPYQQDMQDFYRQIDFVVMPSLMETFGLVALEGMINAKPAVVSSFCGASEIIHDNIDGFIFDMKKNASENLAQKLIYLLENKDKYSEFSKNAHETALKYNWQVFCDKFYEVLS